jgi:hypothetical protein
VEEFQVAVVLIGHFNKTKDGEAITRQGGATAITGVPRIVWNFTKDSDHEGECLMASPKNPHLKGLRYRVVNTVVPLPDGKSTKVGVVEWLGETTKSADENLQDLNSPDQPKIKQARKWLLDQMADGKSNPANKLIAQCAAAVGCAPATVQKAAGRLSLKKENVGGVWRWSLDPKQEQLFDSNKESAA